MTREFRRAGRMARTDQGAQATVVREYWVWTTGRTDPLQWVGGRRCEGQRQFDATKLHRFVQCGVAVVSAGSCARDGRPPGKLRNCGDGPSSGVPHVMYVVARHYPGL